MRQYALEKLGESGEADAVRSRHRDHYTAIAALLDAPARADYEQRLDQAELEMDNLRSAFGWNLENCDTERALTLASSLQPVWLTRGRILEGRAWFAPSSCPTDDQRASRSHRAVHARALADKAVLDMFTSASGMDRAQRAVAIARELDDPALLARALTACGYIAGARYDAEAAAAYYAEAIELARTLDDRWRLSQILTWQATRAISTGDPIAARAAAEEGRDIADAIGDRSNSRHVPAGIGVGTADCRATWPEPSPQFSAVAAECEEAHDEIIRADQPAGPRHSARVPR